MDRFEGRCRLDWWANPSTLLISVEVAVVVTAGDGGWQAYARLAGSDEDRAGFALLCELDPVVDLRFPDGATIPVQVRPEDRDGRIALVSA